MEPQVRFDEMGDGAVDSIRVRWVDQTPNCALCAAPGRGEVADLALTHGVTVRLCVDHRSERFQLQCGGADFAAALRELWTAAGCLTPARAAALRTHLRRATSVRPVRPLPGSYSWPHLREEAERRFAAGEAPLRVIHELRAAHAGHGPRVPSYRTMRRWFEQGRWMNPPPPGEPQATLPDRVFEYLQGLREMNELFDIAFRDWPATDRFGNAYRTRAQARARDPDG